MTPLDLLNSLATRLTELVANTQLYGQDGILHTPQIVLGELPVRQNEEDEDYPDPFVMARFMGITDLIELGRDEGSAEIWIFVGAYEEGTRNKSYKPIDPVYRNRGWDAVLQLMTRIWHGLLSYRMLDNRYELKRPIHMELAQEQAEPQYLGWLITTWRIALPQDEWGMNAIYGGKYETEKSCLETDIVTLPPRR